jgi:hypothetical protein
MSISAVFSYDNIFPNSTLFVLHYRCSDDRLMRRWKTLVVDYSKSRYFS